MNRKNHNHPFRLGLIAVLVGGLAAVATAGLNPGDESIISFYALDEATTGNVDNSVKGSFVDSAPTGTAQDHDDFGDGVSDGPAWLDLDPNNVGSMRIGTGTGLLFEKADEDRTRVAGWMDVAQGNYTQGGSFTIMVRFYATEATDNIIYPLFVNGYTSGLSLTGTSVGTLTVQGKVRDGALNGGTETYWDINSGAAQPSVWWLDANKWYNVFLIYEANANLTVAADDGTANGLLSYTKTGAPAGFNSLLHGFSDSSRHFIIGSNTTTTGGFDGILESIVLWDRALTLEEVDAIDLKTLLTCEELIADGQGLVADLTGDCHVNLLDFGALAAQWNACNDPEDGSCTPNWPTE